MGKNCLYLQFHGQPAVALVFPAGTGSLLCWAVQKPHWEGKSSPQRISAGKRDTGTGQEQGHQASTAELGTPPDTIPVSCFSSPWVTSHNCTKTPRVWVLSKMHQPTMSHSCKFHMWGIREDGELWEQGQSCWGFIYFQNKVKNIKIKIRKHHQRPQQQQ